jgi:hypothetical protein
MDDTVVQTEESAVERITGPALEQLKTERPTLEEIKGWPAAVSISKGCAAFGFSRSHGYELAQRDEFPARLIRAGGRWVVVTADLVRVLGAGETGPDAA